MKVVYCFLLFILSGIGLYAHGDLHERIAKATAEINSYPDSAYLYLKRGKLHYQHESYKLSLKDLKKSRALKFSSTEQKLLFAKNYYQLKAYRKSHRYLNKILKIEPQHVQALNVKAKVFYDKGKFKEAALTHEFVIQSAYETYPENYINAAKAWRYSKEEDGIQKAYDVLNEGITTLGDIVSIYEEVIVLALDQLELDKAIDAQQQILNFSSRKETAYYRLAEIYMLDHNVDKAKMYLSLARSAYDDLPLRIKNTPAMKALIANIDAKEAAIQLSKSN